MMTVYGMTACIDTMKAVADLEEQGIPFRFRNFASDTSALKEFLKIRDDERFHHVFDPVREKGGIGIPLFVSEDGRASLDWKQLKNKT